MDVLSDPMNLPSTFWDYMVKRWLRDAPVFPISQVFGFAQFTATSATRVSTAETTTSTTPTDLATVGPSLSNLPDGKYLFLFGCAGFVPNTVNSLYMGVKINSTEADVNNAAFCSATNSAWVPMITGVTASLSNNGSNTVTSRYWVDGSTGHFQYRWLIALKYGNL